MWFFFRWTKKVLNNMELVGRLLKHRMMIPIAVSRACLLILLGKDRRKQLYDHLRTPDGRVPVEAVSKNMVEIFEIFGNRKKLIALAGMIAADEDALVCDFAETRDVDYNSVAG